MMVRLPHVSGSRGTDVEIDGDGVAVCVWENGFFKRADFPADAGIEIYTTAGSRRRNVIDVECGFAHRDGDWDLR